jgi:hypothetical protein
MHHLPIIKIIKTPKEKKTTNSFLKMNVVAVSLKINAEIICRFPKKLYFCARVSPTRLAPSEFPQGLIAARVGGCSSAM